MTMKQFHALDIEELAALADKIGVSTTNVQTKAQLRARLLNDAKFTP